MESVVDVFCVCRYPDVDITDHFGDMASCDLCGEWFHQHCLDIPNQNGYILTAKLNKMLE